MAKIDELMLVPLVHTYHLQCNAWDDVPLTPVIRYSNDIHQIIGYTYGPKIEKYDDEWIKQNPTKYVFNVGENYNILRGFEPCPVRIGIISVKNGHFLISGQDIPPEQKLITLPELYVVRAEMFHAFDIPHIAVDTKKLRDMLIGGLFDPNPETRRREDYSKKHC